MLRLVEEKVASQVEAAQFRLTTAYPEPVGESVFIHVDEDAFSQILINLVDNALKFSARAENKSIDLGCRLENDAKRAVFFVRDYGPGVERDQMKKIFRLFYRAGNELTRAQPGTGIGLALVTELAARMEGRVDLINRKPGAEFQIKLPLRAQSTREDRETHLA